MSKRPEIVANFNQKPPRKRKAQEPGAQQEHPVSKHRKQVCLLQRPMLSDRSLFLNPLGGPNTLVKSDGLVAYLVSLRVVSV